MFPEPTDPLARLARLADDATVTEIDDEYCAANGFRRGGRVPIAHILA